MKDYATKYDDLSYNGFHCSDPEHIKKAHAVSKSYWNCCGVYTIKQTEHGSLAVFCKIE